MRRWCHASECHITTKASHLFYQRTKTRVRFPNEVYRYISELIFRMMELREKLSGGQKLMLEGRKLVKEGPLFEVTLRQQREVLVYCFLFNGVLLQFASYLNRFVHNININCFQKTVYCFHSRVKQIRTKVPISDHWFIPGS